MATTTVRAADREGQGPLGAVPAAGVEKRHLLDSGDGLCVSAQQPPAGPYGIHRGAAGPAHTEHGHPAAQRRHGPLGVAAASTTTIVPRCSGVWQQACCSA